MVYAFDSNCILLWFQHLCAEQLKQFFIETINKNSFKIHKENHRIDHPKPIKSTPHTLTTHRHEQKKINRKAVRRQRNFRHLQ